VDTTRFVPVTFLQKQNLRKQLDLPQSATIAIYTGRLVSYKGLPLLLKVWNKIRCKHENILLILAGTGGLDIHNCEEALREYVKRSGLEKHVLFTGLVRNVQEYLQSSDIFVFPTENEAFGASLVEAMSCGLPVITTPVGAIKMIISDRENGLLVLPGDFMRLYDAIDVMLSNRELASRLAQTARKSVEERYAVETVNQKYHVLFQSMIPDPWTNRDTKLREQ
jgi:mannosyltransferase